MTTSFLNPNPVMNKKEQDMLQKTAAVPFAGLYTKSTEGQLFDSVKAKRKQDQLPKLKFDSKQISSYNQLAINKYTETSPMSSSLPELEPLPQKTTGAGSVAPTGEIQENFIPLTFTDRVKNKEDALFGAVTGKGAAETLGDVAGLFDVGLQQVAKATAGATVGIAALKFNADELIKSISPAMGDIKELGRDLTIDKFIPTAIDIATGERENPLKEALPFDFMAAAEKTEDVKANAEWLFGTKLEWADYLDVRSSHEKRTEMFNEFSTDKQEALKPLENWALGFDITGSLISGMGIAKAPSALAKKVGLETNLGKTMTALDVTLSQVANKGLPTMGVVVGASAYMYYQQTGKWLFEGDAGATEGAGIMMAAAGLKGLGKVVKGVWTMSKEGKKYISDLYANPEFQDGVNKYFKEVKNQFAEKVDEFATKVGGRTNLVSPSDGEVKRIKQLKVKTVGTSKESQELITNLDKNYGIGVNKKIVNSQYFNDRITNATNNVNEAERILLNYEDLSKSINEGDLKSANGILDENFPFVKRLQDSVPIETIDNIDSAIGKKISIIGKETPTAETRKFGGEAGRFTPSKQEIILFDTPDEKTFVHEFSHNLEQFVTKKESSKITKLYNKSLNSKIDDIYGKTADIDKEKIKEVLQRRTITQPGTSEFGLEGENLQAKVNAFFDDKVFGKLTSEQKDGLYRFANSNEFFAEELTDAFYRGIKPKEGFLKELFKKIKVIFNTREKFFNSLGKTFREGAERNKRGDVFGQDVLKKELTSDDAFVKELSDVRSGKNKIVNTEVSKEIVEKTSGALQSGLKKTTLRERLVNEGLMRENDSIFTGIKRALKRNTLGKLVNTSDEILGELGGDKGVTGFLAPANRPFGTKLDLTRASGQIAHVENKLEDVVLAARTNLEDFNTFLFAKSRYFKTKDTGVKTNLLDGGKVKELTLDEMKEIIVKGEEKFSKLATGIHNEFKSLNERELEAGIRSVDDLANFAKNPYYVGDKELDPEKLLKIGPDNLSSKIPKKFLAKDGKEVLSVNSLDNTFQEIAYRYEALNRVEKINIAIEGLPKDFTALVTGQKPGVGKIAFNHYQDGKLIRMQGPKFWVEDLFKNDRLSATNVATALPRYMTRTFKELQTGRLSVTTGYPIVAPLLELPPAMLRSLAEWKGGKEFYKNLLTNITGGKIRTGMATDPRVASAIEEMADQFGFTFTQSKQLKRELKETIGQGYTVYNAQKSKFQKGKEAGTKVLDFIDIGNVIEKKTIRMPLYMQGLAKQGLTKESAGKFLKEANYDVNAFRKILEKNGIDPKVAGDAAVNVFDYYGVTKLAREIGSMVPYFNSAASQAKSTKTLFEKNPKLFIASTMGAGYYMSDGIYKFNTNTEEKKTAYENMPNYRKNSPMLYFGQDENGEEVFMRVARGLQPLEWSYPLYVESQESAEGGEFSFNDAFGKMFEDSTGLKPNVTDWGQYIPQGLKQGAEVAFDIDFFTKQQRKVAPDAKEYPTQDFNKNTSKAAIKLSRLLAGIDIVPFEAGVMGRDGVIRGGLQVSPIEIDKMIDSFDNGTLRGAIGNLITDVEQEGKVDKKKLLDVSQHFIRKSNVKLTSDELFEDKGTADAETFITNNKINSTIKDSSAEDLSGNVKELVALYPNKTKEIMAKALDKKKEDKIREKIDNKDPLYVGDLIRASKMSNTQIAFHYLGRTDRDGKEKAKKFLNDMMRSGLIKPSKLVTIINKIAEVSRNNETNANKKD